MNLNILLMTLFSTGYTFSLHSSEETYEDVSSKTKNGNKVVSKIENGGDCYKELGCFPNNFPWTSDLRPVPKPENPLKINTTVRLYTRKCINGTDLILWPDVVFDNVCFKVSQLPFVFITHGFLSNGQKDWVMDMKNAYLKQLDANVFVVDWKEGSNSTNYFQVVSNTRIVAAEISRLINKMIDWNLISLENIHLIGHCLGAHISGYIAKNLTFVDQITALDPAQPSFEGTPKSVRLDKDDARYVEVIHTNTLPFVPHLGFGYINPLGHTDFYVNGGLSQPGCKTSFFGLDGILEAPNSIADLANIPLETLREIVACSHGRAYLYYTEALSNLRCRIWGKRHGYFKHELLGRHKNTYSEQQLKDWWEMIEECTIEDCVPLGLFSRHSPLTGKFDVITQDSAPYCHKF